MIHQSVLYTAITLIPSRYKRRGIYLILLLIVGSLLDLFSLATFLPLIILVINPDETTNGIFFSSLNGFIKINDPVHLALVLTGVVLLLLIIKTQINVWITYRKARYAYAVADDLASRAISKYLSIPYIQFTNIDYTREMNKISNLPLVFANNFIIPLGTLLSESFILLLLLSSIIWYDVKVFFFILAIVSPVAALYWYKRVKIKEISKQIKQIYPLSLKYALQIVEGLAEIRLFKKESFFKRRFEDTYSTFTQTFVKDHVAHTSMTRITELTAALCICLLIMYVLFSRLPYQQSALLLSLYAAASFRAIPSVNRILSASMQAKTHEYATQELTGMLAPGNNDFETTVTPIPFREKIQLCDLSFGHEGKPLLLNKASLIIRKGEKVGLFGKSGIGKTTLFLIMMRFLKEREGKIMVDDLEIDDENALSWLRLIGYVPQQPYILDASLIENIAFGIPLEKIDLERIRSLMRELDLESWTNSLPENIHTVIGEKGLRISGGQRQRIAIARALYHDAEILLLDEVTNQLDKETEMEILESLEKSSLWNKTVIMITHHHRLLDRFDSVYELSEGSMKKIDHKVSVSG